MAIVETGAELLPGEFPPFQAAGVPGVDKLVRCRLEKLRESSVEMCDRHAGTRCQFLRRNCVGIVCFQISKRRRQILKLGRAIFRRRAGISRTSDTDCLPTT